MNRPAWQQHGEEPDYRFTLANERTFLAWIRTALAVLAGGVALDQFATNAGARGWVTVIAWVLSMLGALLATGAYHRWKGNEIAMRHRGPLPSTGAIPLLASAIAGIAALLAVRHFLNTL